MPMKMLVPAATAAMILTACSTGDQLAPAPAAAAHAVAANGLPVNTRDYLEMAASSDLFEIETSRLALQRSSAPPVRSFAQMLIADHGRLSQTMTESARAAGLDPPQPMLLPRQEEMLQRLQAASPAEFEAAYRNEQIVAHQEARALHETYAREGDVAVLRDVAASALPVIRTHLERALALPQAGPAPAAPLAAGERG